jgi:hypothetical protein
MLRMVAASVAPHLRPTTFVLYICRVVPWCRVYRNTSVLYSYCTTTELLYPRVAGAARARTPDGEAETSPNHCCCYRRGTSLDLGVPVGPPVLEKLGPHSHSVKHPRKQ